MSSDDLPLLVRMAQDRKRRGLVLSAEEQRALDMLADVRRWERYGRV